MRVQLSLAFAAVPVPRGLDVLPPFPSFPCASQPAIEAARHKLAGDRASPARGGGRCKRRPLPVGFQGRPPDEDGVRRLVQDLNDTAEKRMPKDRLDVVFKNMWPDLQAAFDEAIQGVPATQEPQRSEMDMLAEVAVWNVQANG